jgi:hypothetical protein
MNPIDISALPLDDLAALQGSPVAEELAELTVQFDDEPCGEAFSFQSALD